MGTTPPQHQGDATQPEKGEVAEPGQDSFRTLQPGLLIGGCQIESLVAVGGMGAVYRARQVLLDRVVALKVMSPRLLQHRKTIRSFLQEGKLMARLEHPAIVRVYSTGQESGLHFLVMEYVEGTDLRQKLAMSGAMTPRQALNVVGQVADVLAFAHEHGVIHLDIKPANIILTRAGGVKVTDFGISHLIKQSGQAQWSGPLLGTPAYMSPEQCAAGKITATSDIYSLGATLYSLLTGRPPFIGRTGTQILRQVLEKSPPALELLAPNLPEKVIRLVHRMMAKTPEVRFRTARDVSVAVHGIASGDLYGSVAHPRWSLSRLRKRATWWHVACAVFLAWTAVLLYWCLSPQMWRGAATAEELTAGTSAGTPEPSGGAGSPAVGNHPAVPLEERVDAFLGLLGSAPSDALFDFLPPDKRDDFRIRGTLTDLVRLLKRRADLQKGTFEVQPNGPDQARVILSFPEESSSHRLSFRLHWRKDTRGHWHIFPDRQFLRGW